MFVIKKNISLKPYNTFGIDVSTAYYANANTVEKVLFAINFASYNQLPIMLMGGGSNLLFTKDYEGIIIHPSIKGIAIMEDFPDEVILRVGAGVVWDQFVEYCVDRGWGGIENLSMIPGEVGASPIQNIGAYGVEAKNTILKVEAVDIAARKIIEINASECHFGYRDSIFKQELKGKVVVTHVWYRLSKKPALAIDYGNLKEELDKIGETNVQTVRQAVINIRTRKLPDPAVLGNAGSFFKNPVVDIDLFQKIQQKYSNVPSYKVSESFVKIPAGWLIEQCGWKGKQVGNCGVHKEQALVLVNYGGATGTEIFNLAKEILKSVSETFAVNLEMEVNVL